MWTENQGPEARVTHAVLGVQLKGVAGPMGLCLGVHTCVCVGGAWEAKLAGGSDCRRRWEEGSGSVMQFGFHPEGVSFSCSQSFQTVPVLSPSAKPPILGGPTSSSRLESRCFLSLPPRPGGSSAGCPRRAAPLPQALHTPCPVSRGDPKGSLYPPEVWHLWALDSVKTASRSSPRPLHRAKFPG